MKVTGIETILLNNTPPYRGGRTFLFIKLSTDEGIVGLGERPTGHTPDLKSQIALLHDLVERFVVGKSPFEIERIWQAIYASNHDYRHPSLYGTPALSAIEMALWDIIGKATGQPIYNLLGGACHDRLRAYAYMPTDGVWDDPKRAGDIAQRLVDEGNTACKIDPFMPYFPLPRDFPLKTIKHAARIFEAIREAVGDDLEIGIGTHGQFSTAGAIRVASVFEQFHPYWFEEPVPPENVDEMARVARQTSIPIASGERLVSVYEFAELIEKQAAQIIQLDVGQCGGILQSRKIAGIAEAHYAMIAPHMYVGPIAAAAAVQVDACSPNFLIQEYNGGPLHEDLFVNPIRFRDGFIELPTGPGLGLELDDDRVEHQRVDA